MSSKMDIKNPKRALAISLTSDKDHLSRVIHDITGSKPTSSEGSLAGITHDLALKTKYYTATVPIWLDLIDSPSEWAASFLSPEAIEVLTVLGGLILVFSIPPATASASADATRQLISHVGKVVHDGLGGWEWDGVKLAVGVGSSSSDGDVDEWDELCAEAGLEFVQVGGDDNKLQQFGEKNGIPRVKEALEANEWDQALPSDDEEEENNSKQPSSDKGPPPAHLDPENMDFGLGQADLETLKRAIFSNTTATDDDPAEEESSSGGKDKMEQTVGEKEEIINDDDVAKVEAMMRKLQAAREAGETMGETQRRKMAAKAVEEVMREL